MPSGPIATRVEVVHRERAPEPAPLASHGDRPLLEAARLAKRFGGITAVADVDLTVRQGEFLTLLGPSGCGKTTLLRLIAGLEEPDAGRLHLDGREITTLAAAARGFGFVFQAYALFPTKTVEENVAFPLQLRRVQPAERARRARALAERLQIADLLQRFPHELSGGQQQRVALARALAMEPPVLLLDEPLSALDARIRQHLRQELRQSVTEAGVTAIYVTHDQEEALELSDRIAVMDGGRIAQLGSPEDVYLRPATAYVAAFVGRATLLPVTVGPGGLLRPETGSPIEDVRATLPTGSRGLLCIRPEFVELAPAGTAPLRGVVRGAVFTGAMVRVTLEGPWSLPVEAEVPHRAWRRLGLRLGDVAGLRLHLDEVVVVPRTMP